MELLIRSLAVASLVAAGAAQAHVVVDPATGRGGSYTRVLFRVGHGCDGAATTALVVRFPADILVAQAQPKAGWTLSAKKEPPLEITWRGRLEADQFDEFGAFFRLPSKAGARTFAIRQECEGKSADWTPTLEVTGTP